MGNCLETIFHLTHGKQVTPRHQNLLFSSTSKQLNLILKGSTQNDKYFYCAPNLQKMEDILDTFYLNSMKIQKTVIEENIKRIEDYIRMMRDRNSAVGKYFIKDKQSINRFIQQGNKVAKISKQIDVQKNKKLLKTENCVLVKLQIQILIPAWEEFIQLLSKKNIGKFIYMLEVFQENSTKQLTFLTSLQLISSRQSEKDQNIRSSIGSTSKKWKSTATTHDQERRNSKEEEQKGGSPSKLKSSSIENAIDQIPIFQFFNNISQKNNGLVFKVTKSKRLSRGKQRVSNFDNKYENSQENQEKKQVLGKTTVQINDLIFRNSLMVSDVLPMNRPSEEENIGIPDKLGYISIRAQAFSADTFQKDYAKIMKHHEQIRKQLCFLLQGQKGWQKLSQYKNSNESNKKSIQRSASVYSQFQYQENMNKF